MAVVTLKEKMPAEQSLTVLAADNTRELKLREAANRLNLEGFTVTRCDVFEDPLIALIDVDNLIEGGAILAKFVKLANGAFKDLNFGFFVVLTLTDFMTSTVGLEVIYTIKRHAIDSGDYTNEVSVAISNKVKTSTVFAANQENLTEIMLRQAV